MRKTLYAFGAAASLLLFVGGGCAPRSPEPAAETKTGAAVETTTATQGSVDAAVDAVIIDTMTEQSAQRRMETEAEGMSSDQAEINAYGQADYDLK